MRLLVLIITLCSQFAWAADEFDLFKESATQILVGEYLERTEYGAYVCVAVEGKAPSEAQIASFRAFGTREVGPPSECECHKNEVDDGQCFNRNSKRPACLLSVDRFQFHAFTNASASVSQTCGETNGGGEVAAFEKRDGTWRHTGSSEQFVQ